jgi:hypothetical protein
VAGFVAHREPQPRYIRQVRRRTGDHALDHQHQHAVMAFGGGPDFRKQQPAQIDRQTDRRIERGSLGRHSYHVGMPADQCGTERNKY